MARERSPLWFITVGICAVVSIASIVNVYGDNADVEAKARNLACPEAKACSLYQMERSPFSQTYRFTVMRVGTVTVKCSRGAIFFGEYDCEKK
jgi:hypothetical protein